MISKLNEYTTEFGSDKTEPVTKATSQSRVKTLNEVNTIYHVPEKQGPPSGLVVEVILISFVFLIIDSEWRHFRGKIKWTGTLSRQNKVDGYSFEAKGMFFFSPFSFRFVLYYFFMGSNLNKTVCLSQKQTVSLFEQVPF